MIYFKIAWRWYDMWIGFYWNERKKVLYFCPLPFVVIAISKDSNLQIPT